MSLLFLTYGPTHSGKTTFGQKLRDRLGESAKFIHVDNDAVDEFVKENYNKLSTDPDVLARRTPSDPDLRLLIPKLIAGYALGERYSVITTVAHPKQVIRQVYYQIVKKNDVQVVLLLFRISDEQAARRIKNNARSTSILDISPHGGTHFQELFDKQKNILEEPSDVERRACFKVFEVTESNCDEVLKKVSELCTGMA
jgi:tRNA A37 N6-isopentenylltransferase MiaA